MPSARQAVSAGYRAVGIATARQTGQSGQGPEQARIQSMSERPASGKCEKGLNVALWVSAASLLAYALSEAVCLRAKSALSALSGRDTGQTS